MGGDSCSKGRGFESRHRNCNDVCLRRTKKMINETGVGTFKKVRPDIGPETSRVAQERALQATMSIIIFEGK